MGRLETLLGLDRAMTTHVNRDMELRGNVLENNMTSRLRDFVRINPPTILGSKVGEDPRSF